MNKIKLYTTFYNEENKARRLELVKCVQNNLSNPEIYSVTIFNEGESLKGLISNNFIEVEIDKRPTYKDFISYINMKSISSDIHIIANTDIFFDQQIGVLKQVLEHNTCFALSRWDTGESYKPILYNHNDSQDVWIFKGRIKDNIQADYPLGVPRCDNRLMYDLEKAGYMVLNPSFSIKAYHLHKGQREIIYSDSDNKYMIKEPYRYKYPHNLYGLCKTLWFNITQTYKIGVYRYDLKKINKWLIVRLFRKCFETITKKKLPLIGYSD